MLIQTIIQNEAERNKRMILEYKALIDGLPKGSLICRKNEYYYLKYRENGKLHDKYLGKDGDAVEEIRSQIALRKHYCQMLTALEQEQKTIQKLLGELS